MPPVEPPLGATSLRRVLFLKFYPFFLHHRQIIMRSFRPIFRLVAVLYAGKNVHCPCCGGNYRKFLRFGAPPVAQRDNALCPGCFALERHRLIWRYFGERTDLFTARLEFLHVAPEFIFQRKLRELPNLDYLSADLMPTEAMVQMDITDIHLPDDQFDAIYCSHVFEHIPDDRKAMSELFRVLKPGGWAILQVPQDITMKLTKEGTDEMTPLQKELEFGHHDHLRLYGLDYGDRLEEAGFDVSVVDYATELGPDAVRMFGFRVGEPIYHCRKSVAAKKSAAVRTDRLEAVAVDSPV